MTAAGGRPSEVVIGELVLVRGVDEPAEALTDRLRDALADHGVPDPAGTAAAILGQLDGRRDR